MKTISISKEFAFEAAHHLPGHEKCGTLHGHSYTGEVTISANELNEHGMIVDYYILKNIIKEEILDICDHKDLNEVLPKYGIQGPPTAEILANWMYDRIKNRLRLELPLVFLEEVALKETSTSKCTVKHT